MRSRVKPRGAGVVVVVAADCAEPPFPASLLPFFLDFFEEAVAATASAASSDEVKTSPMEQLIYTLGGGGSTAFPLPFGSGVGGGGDGIFSTEDNISSSFRSFPLCINRNRCWEVGGSSFDRMRCLNAMTVVSSGSGISSRRSGIEVVNRTVMWRGSAEGTRGDDILGRSFKRPGHDEAHRENRQISRMKTEFTSLPILKY